RLVVVEAVVVARPHRLERGPGLPGRRNVLAFLAADRAGGGRLVGGCVLRSAGGADEGRHVTMLAHVPEKCLPVFRKDMHQCKSMCRQVGNQVTTSESGPRSRQRPWSHIMSTCLSS